MADQQTNNISTQKLSYIDKKVTSATESFVCPEIETELRNSTHSRNVFKVQSDILKPHVETVKLFSCLNDIVKL